MFMKIEYMKYICYLPASFYHSCGREDVLVKQHAMRMPQIFICGLSDSSIFFHIITKIDLKIIIIIIIIIINFNWAVTFGSGYFTCIQNMKLLTTKFNSGGLHEKHVVATWNLGNHLSVCF